MSDQFRDKPSSWLMYNSMGYPDFLFTILTFSMGLLGLITIVWLTFAVLAYLNVLTPSAEVSLRVMDNMQSGLISLVGVVFSLAGGYVVRRYKKDEHYVEKTRLEHDMVMDEVETTVAPAAVAARSVAPPATTHMEDGLGLVAHEEDI